MKMTIFLQFFFEQQRQTKIRPRMYDVLKGDYAKPNGITENRLKKPIMQNHRSEIPNDGFVYPALLDVELNPWFCRGKKIMR